jgi:HEAT repeat protein
MFLTGPLLFFLLLLQQAQLVGEILSDKVKTYDAQPASYWLRQLKFGDQEQQTVALFALYRIGPQAKCARPTLFRMLENRHKLFDRVIFTLSQIETDAEPLASHLKRLLAESKPEVRFAVYQGLFSLIGDKEVKPHPAFRRILPELLNALQKANEKEGARIRQLLAESHFDLPQDMPIFRQMLRHPRKEARLAALKALHNPLTPGDIVPDLALLLKAKDPEENGMALSCLCKLAGVGKADLTYLVQGLQAKNEYARGSAVCGISNCKQQAQALVPSLLAALQKTRDRDLRLDLADALIEINVHPKGWETLEALCDSIGTDIQSEAIRTLGKWAIKEDRAYRKMRELLLNKDWKLEREPVNAFYFLEKKLFPLLAEALASPRRYVRHHALLLLDRYAFDADAAAQEHVPFVPLERPELTRLLLPYCRRETDPELQFKAALILAFRTHDPAGILYLGQGVRNPALQLQDRQDGIRQFSWIYSDSLDAARHLLHLLQEPDTNVRVDAARALGKMEVKHDLIVDALAKLLLDADPQLRSAGAEALGEYGPGARRILPDLYRLWNDASPEVVVSALQAVRQLETHIDARRLRRYLKDAIPEVRAAAAAALVKSGPSIQEVVPEIQMLMNYTNYKVRSELLVTIQQLRLKDRWAMACLSQALQDKEPGIARLALETLRLYERLPPDILEQVYRLFLYQSSVMRLTAASVLLKQRSPLALAVMAKGFQDAECHFSSHMVACLHEHGAEAKPLVPHLVDLIRNRNQDQEVFFWRDGVALILWRLERHPLAIPTLLETLRTAPTVGQYSPHLHFVCQALTQIGPEAKAALPLLRQYLSHCHPHERPAVRQSIQALEGSSGR